MESRASLCVPTLGGTCCPFFAVPRRSCAWSKTFRVYQHGTHNALVDTCSKRVDICQQEIRIYQGLVSDHLEKGAVRSAM